MTQRKKYLNKCFNLLEIRVINIIIAKLLLVTFLVSEDSLKILVRAQHESHYNILLIGA